MEAERRPSGGVESKGKREAFPHLRSLSTYSRRILCDSADGWPNFGQSLSAATPFCNIKIEIVNSEASRSSKRCLDDPSVERECGPPARKRMALGASAPDSGSALDSRGDFLGKSEDPGSYAKPQKPTMIRKVGRGKPVRSAATLPKLGSAKPDGVAPGVLPHVKVEDRVSTLSQIPPLNSKCLPLKAGSPAQPGQESPLEFDINHAFDFDIEEILSLSPIYSGASDDSESIEAFIESCHSFYEASQAQSPTSCHAQGAEPAGGVGEASRKERCHWTRVTSRGRIARRYGGGPRVLDSSPKSALCTAALSLWGRGESRPIESRRLWVWAGPCKAPPLWLSLSCAGTCCRFWTTPQRRSPQGQGRGLRVGGKRGSSSKRNNGAVETTDSSPHQDTTGVFCESTNTSFNDTILPPVQVRSVVVVPQRRVEPEDVKETLKLLKRPVVFESESDWQREKDLYVAAVSSHMANSAPSGGGVMSELVNLMRTVARQGTTNSKQEPWQHPADLTRRNYKIPSGKAKISLDEWQKRNRRTFCRFAGIPAKFQRSPIL
ncbi:hypothetical protein GJAV_G00001490 [Gymnothorax javanicus]|nr:hypothetical protein GJAV_G00001490 [Gymnothorax javanicus]